MQTRSQMGQSSWREQIRRALGSINYIGESKHEAKQAQGCRPGDPVAGLYGFGYFNTVFDRSMTYTHWLGMEHPAVRTFREVDAEMTSMGAIHRAGHMRQTNRARSRCGSTRVIPTMGRRFNSFWRVGRGLMRRCTCVRTRFFVTRNAWSC